MNPIIPLVVTMQTFMCDRVERLKERSDRGAGMVEYGALIILVAAILAVLISDNIIGTTVKDGIKGAIDQVFTQKAKAP